MWESVQKKQHFVDPFVDPQWYKALSLQVRTSKLFVGFLFNLWFLSISQLLRQEISSEIRHEKAWWVWKLWKAMQQTNSIYLSQQCTFIRGKSLISARFALKLSVSLQTCKFPNFTHHKQLSNNIYSQQNNSHEKTRKLQAVLMRSLWRSVSKKSRLKKTPRVSTSDWKRKWCK